MSERRTLWNWIGTGMWVAAGVLLFIWALLGIMRSMDSEPGFYCDGNVGVYYKSRAISAVVDHPACKEGT